jgi:hypothetical protein
VGFELIHTPAALIDHAQMSRNIARMQTRMEALGVRFRPHVKTTKCIPIVREQIAAGACGITVSTLKEAEQFFAEGIVDILYAVGMVPAKLPQAAALVKGISNASAIAFDVSDTQKLSHYIKGSDIVVSLLPATMHGPVAAACVREKRHMVFTPILPNDVASSVNCRSPPVMCLPPSKSCTPLLPRLEFAS